MIAKEKRTRAAWIIEIPIPVIFFLPGVDSNGPPTSALKCRAC
jgi:hypothetical protein